MDFKEYKDLYQRLLDSKGRAEIGDDPNRIKDIEQKINQFLEKYPSVIPPDKRPDALFTQISLKELLKRTIQTAIDVINDVSEVVTKKDSLSKTEFRRKLFRTVTAPDRRLYVGVWLVVFSFILYFVDSTA